MRRERVAWALLVPLLWGGSTWAGGIALAVRTVASSDSIELRWTVAGGRQFQSFAVLRSTFDLNETPLARLSEFPVKRVDIADSMVRSYVDCGRADDATHYYRVTGFGGRGAAVSNVCSIVTARVRVEPDSVRRPRLVIVKSECTLALCSDRTLIKRYPLVLGLNPVERKARRGDYCTPEGAYYVCQKVPHSTFYKGFLLSYPDSADAARGLGRGIIGRGEYDAILAALRRRSVPPQNTLLGGEIEIHGHGLGPNWTWGCIALRDRDIDELWPIVRVGTPVTILP